MTTSDLTKPTQTQTLLAMLLADASRELQNWIANQQELGAITAPVDDPTWGNAQNLPQYQQPTTQTAAKPTTVIPPHTAQKSKTNSSQATTMAMFKSLRKESPKPQLYTTHEKILALDVHAAKIGACRQCMLGNLRQRIFAGYGPANAQIMFVAAGGNPKEPDAGRIMTGEAAEMLDKIIAAMANLSPIATPERIYMTNVIKCAHLPPRTQALDTAKKCLPLLREEINIIAPKVIIIWGELAFRAMFGSDALISQVRGQIFKFEGFSAIPTHHPMEMIKNPKLKARTWDDLQLALDIAKK